MYRIKSQHEQKGFLHWWYRVTSPPEPEAPASFQKRELFRRGRTGSQICIFLFLLLFLSFPAAFIGSNQLLIVILTINLVLLVFALVLNRMQRVNIAGIMVVIGVVLGPTVNILTTPGGVNTSALPIFSFLVLPLMCAVSFLPPAWVFVIAAANCLFTLSVLRFLPSSGELHEVLKVAFPGIVTPIILSQVIVAIVAFIWVKGAREALMRADRAEEIARLEHDLAVHAAKEVQQKELLDRSIMLIEQTHRNVANGIHTARVPLTEYNVLWQISGSLNNLLARYQSMQAEVRQLLQLRRDLQRAREEITQLPLVRKDLQRAHEEIERLRRQLNQP